jgi:hypothetical protein
MHTVTQVRSFITHITLELDLEPDAVRREAIQLGTRHKVYFDEGFQQSFWDSFCQSIRDSITELVTTYSEETAVSLKHKF